MTSPTRAHTSRPAIEVLDAQFLASAPNVSRLPPPVFAEAAFAGKSNVGKSSLINALSGRRKLVRVSGTPGCTRGLNLFRLELAERADADDTLRHATLDLVDLPGYGYARRSKQELASWGDMIEGFLVQRAGLRVVVLIVDVRRGVTDEDRQLLDFLAHVGRECLLVATKLDKLPRSKRRPALAAIEREVPGRPVLGFSAQDGEGKGPLWRAVADRAGLFPRLDPAADAG
jgi:GTP-binding protein